MLVRVRERQPVADVFGLERDLNRIFRGADVPTQIARPCTVSSDANSVTVRAELPGIEPADIVVTVEHHTLTIAVEHRADATQEQPSIPGAETARERPQREPVHAFRLSQDLDSEAVTADCRNGVLTVRVPKRAAAQARQIEIKTS